MIAQNKEIVRKWILDTARAFKAKYFSNNAGTAGETSSSSGDVDNNNKSMSQTSDLSSTVNVLDRLKRLVVDLNRYSNNSNEESRGGYLACMAKIGQILKETDISSFEMIHSGLIESLSKFLIIDLNATNETASSCSILLKSSKVKPSYLADMNRIFSNENKVFNKEFFYLTEFCVKNNQKNIIWIYFIKILEIQI